MDKGAAVAATIVSLAILVTGAGPRAGQPAAGGVAAYVSFSDALPILESLRADVLPPDLRPPFGRSARWDEWIARHDRAIRARVLAGDDESVLNLLLFGTAFTRRPRATEREIAQLAGTVDRNSLIDGRIADLVAGASSPGDNARLRFTRDLLARHGANVATPDGRAAAARYLQEGLDRMAADIVRIDQAVDTAGALNQPAGSLVARATLFRDRGLSTDTSVFSSFAIDRALDGLAASGTIEPGGVRRVAIVGPGLDFVDKRDGFDFYPPQTIQPFAVMDSLLRHGLSRHGDLRVATLDLNPRINDHVARTAEQATRGSGYTLTLVRDLGLPWTSRLVAYWEALGDRVAAPGPAPASPPGVKDVQVRTLAVRASVAAMLRSHDVNIIVQRLEGLGAGERFDLIVATDILVYYDVFEQSLALSNIAAMLRPGGIFLSNTTLSELPALPIGSIGFSDVVYLEEPQLGDRLVWYQRK